MSASIPSPVLLRQCFYMQRVTSAICNQYSAGWCYAEIQNMLCPAAIIRTVTAPQEGAGQPRSAGLSCRMREVLVSTETFVTKKCPLAFLGILHNFAVLPAQFWWFQWASWSSLLCAISAYLVLIKGPLLMSGFRYLVLLILRLPQQ